MTIKEYSSIMGSIADMVNAKYDYLLCREGKPPVLEVYIGSDMYHQSRREEMLERSRVLGGGLPEFLPYPATNHIGTICGFKMFKVNRKDYGVRIIPVRNNKYY